MQWPTVQEVHAYRCDVYNLVSEVIATAPDHAISNITMDSPYWALPMSFEHELIHVETSRFVRSPGDEGAACFARQQLQAVQSF